MAEDNQNPNTGPAPVAQPEPQNVVASVDNGATMPAVDPAAITREASNIARELRTLAHRVEGFKINFSR